MDIDQVIHKCSTKLKWAASRERGSICDSVGSWGKSGKDSRRGGIAGHQLSDSKGAKVSGTNTGGERDAKCSGIAGEWGGRRVFWLGSKEIRVQGKERAVGRGRGRGMQKSNGTGNSIGKRQTRGRKHGSSGQWDMQVTLT